MRNLRSAALLSLALRLVVRSKTSLHLISLQKLLPNCPQHIFLINNLFFASSRIYAKLLECHQHVHCWWLTFEPLISSSLIKNFWQSRLTCYSKLQRFAWGTPSLIRFVCKKTHTASYLSWDFSCKSTEFAHSPFNFAKSKSPRLVMLLIHNGNKWSQCHIEFISQQHTNKEIFCESKET